MVHELVVQEDGKRWRVAALYAFAPVEDPEGLRRLLFQFGRDYHLCGTLLVAGEGLNGTVAGSEEGIAALRDYLDSDPRWVGMEYKESWASEQPFHRWKVKCKKEIVTMGVASMDPSRDRGTYVDAQGWNALLQDPEVVVLDTRNDYEFQLGTFRGALNPKTQNFREFPGYVKEHVEEFRQKKMALFCTGGIRCEKATAYLRHLGCEEVYHLHGGILRYLETVPPEESLWEGECFVFDGRVTLSHGLEEGVSQLCHGCKHPLSPEDRQHRSYEEGVSCPHCNEGLSDSRRAALRERNLQMRLAEARGEKHLGRSHRPSCDTLQP
jgi:UPF0176 protein